MKRLTIFLTLVLSLILSKTWSQAKDSTWRIVPMSEFYARYSPTDYLRVLEEDFKDKRKSSVFTITTSPDNWIREEHIEWLMRLINRTDSTNSIMNSFSSSIPTGKYSSIGREAQNLVNCFRTEKSYPDFLVSFGAPDKLRAQELNDWWRKYKLWNR